MIFSSTTFKQLIGIGILFILITYPNIYHAQSNKTYSTNYNSNNGKHTIRVKDDKNDFEIEYEGDITLSNDDKDITAISDGGFIEITTKSFGNKRRVLIESDRSGRLIKKYFVGRSEKDYNTEGKKWLSEILPEVVRSTTIGAESRVNRFYSNGGAQSVLNEIERMSSDYVQSAYLKLLLEKDLNSNDFIAVMNTVAKTIESDYYLAEILKNYQSKFLSSPQHVNAYIKAAKTIKSDHHLTTVLRKIIEDGSITDDQLTNVLSISSSIQSDHYLAEVLSKVIENRTNNGDNIKTIINLAKGIESDHYKSNVLIKLLNSNNLPNGISDSFIEGLKDVQSDHYSTNVIVKLLDSRLEINDNSFDKLIGLVGDIVKSDHYQSNIYKKLAKRNLSESQLISIFNSVTDIKSDHYLSELLLAYAGKVNASSENVKSAYRDAAKSISSDTYYGKVAKAID